MKRREIRNMLLRRLIMAWQFKVWPWTIPWQAVKWVSLDQRLTARDIERTKQLAREYGWEIEEGDNGPSNQPVDLRDKAIDG